MSVTSPTFGNPFEGLKGPGDGGGVEGIDSIGGTSAVVEGSGTEGGVRASILSADAIMGPTSIEVDVGRCIIVDGSGSTCSETGMEACEVQMIINDGRHNT